eukprot:TRINITY_DN3542_c0_g1_i2.p1 TRINITY_DN3542_c0_g1~~TRINITY_DN3542_c0_g1_i2.p1  ORF type:complete len:403 (+),score=81.80 TRINITY_DN3542_c0_g1_i2:97-1305(+)
MKKEKDTNNVKKLKLPPLPKGKTVFHVFAEEKKLYDKIPNWKTKKLLQNKKIVTISGPGLEEIPAYDFTRACGSTISTYPFYPDNSSREGDPICDSFKVQTHENGVLFCVTDGCNWGERPRDASNRAKDSFVSYLGSKITEIKNLREVGPHLVQALAYAHQAIIYDKEDVWMAGTTTLLGGVVLQIDNKGCTDPPWGLVCISIGDCKAFHYSWKEKKVCDVTAGNRLNITDARDPGGRIGPYVKDGEPDLRNLTIVALGVEDDDIILTVSDGVHDNLDPQTLGKSPRELGVDCDDWKEVDSAIATEKKQSFECAKLLEIIGENESLITPKLITRRLLNHCMTTTSSGREFMEQNPNCALEHDYHKYPGKMDHTTCVGFRVGLNDPEKEKNRMESLNPDIWPF